MDYLEVQLTLKHCGFELHGPTYTWIFFFLTVNTTVLYNLWLLESTNVEELWIWRADSHRLTTMLFKGQLDIAYLVHISFESCAY